MSRTAMGIDHLRATGMPDVSNPGGPDVAVPPADVGRWNQAPLGFIHCEPASQVPLEIDGTPQPIGLTGAGDQEWIYIYHDGLAGTTLAAGDVCVRDGLTTAPTGFGAAYADHSPAVASSGATVIGVAQYAIPAGFFGFILRKGQVLSLTTLLLLGGFHSLHLPLTLLRLMKVLPQPQGLGLASIMLLLGCKTLFLTVTGKHIERERGG